MSIGYLDPWGMRVLGMTTFECGVLVFGAGAPSP